MPAFAVTSVNCGTARPAHFTTVAPGGGGGGVGCASCPIAIGAESRTIAQNRNALMLERFFNE
jgi:hypothetical protein